MATTAPPDRLLLSPTRQAILDALEDPVSSGADDAMETSAGHGHTAGELAAALGLHVTTVRFHLEQLVSAGLVATALRRGSVGRPRKLYIDARDSEDRVAPGALGVPGALQAFTELLTSAYADAAAGAPLDPEAAGRQWMESHTDRPVPPPATTPGTWLGKVGQAVDLLEEWGYEPELRTTSGGRTVELTLHDCPFMGMARAHPEVVCGIHRGLIRGTLAAVGEQDADLELLPFVTDYTCLARVTTASVAPRDPRALRADRGRPAAGREA